MSGRAFRAAGRGVLQQLLREVHGVEELLRQRRQRRRGGRRRGAALGVALGVRHLADLGEVMGSPNQISNIDEQHMYYIYIHLHMLHMYNG